MSPALLAACMTALDEEEEDFRDEEREAPPPRVRRLPAAPPPEPSREVPPGAEVVGTDILGRPILRGSRLCDIPEMASFLRTLAMPHEEDPLRDGAPGVDMFRVPLASVVIAATHCRRYWAAVSEVDGKPAPLAYYLRRETARAVARRITGVPSPAPLDTRKVSQAVIIMLRHRLTFPDACKAVIES